MSVKEGDSGEVVRERVEEIERVGRAGEKEIN